MSCALSILIVNWNTSAILKSCLGSIFQHPPEAPFDVWVFDNASQDDSCAMLARDFPQVQVLANPENIGFARGNNALAERAQGEFLLLLNSDTICHADALCDLLRYGQSHPQVGITGCRLLNPDGSLQISASPAPTLLREAWRLSHLDNWQVRSAYPANYFTATTPQPADVLLGACLLLRRELYQQLGGFDPDFFMYSEEVDLCERVRQAGYVLHYLPSATITHLGGQSTRQMADQMFLELYRNKIKFFRKRRPAWQTPLYKLVLAVTALPRWLGGRLFGKMPLVARQYGMLLRMLPKL